MKKMILIKGWSVRISVLVIVISCSVISKRERQVAAKEDPWYLFSYTINDGYDNRYVFSRASFQYFPVQTAGPGNQEKTIKKLPELNRFYTLVDLVKNAFEARFDHRIGDKEVTGMMQINVWSESNEWLSRCTLDTNTLSQKELLTQLSLMKK